MPVVRAKVHRPRRPARRRGRRLGAGLMTGELIKLNRAAAVDPVGAADVVARYLERLDR